MANLRHIPGNQRVEVAPRRARLIQECRDPEMKLGETLRRVGSLPLFQRVRDVLDFARATGQFIKEYGPTMQVFWRILHRLDQCNASFNLAVQLLDGHDLRAIFDGANSFRFFPQ